MRMYLLFVLLLFSCTPEEPMVVIFSEEGELEIFVEKAITPEEQGRGLMERDTLPEDRGMLFIFNTTSVKTFWMKNTLIPLDIIFISDEMRITTIQNNAEPCRGDPCPVYSSILPARYVLEVNGGFCIEKGIKPGDRIRI